VGAAGGVALFSFIIAAAVSAQISYGGEMLSIIYSLAIACVMVFFDVLLDYDKAENVQFQDEDNYYYVKIVPKIISRNVPDRARYSTNVLSGDTIGDTIKRNVVKNDVMGDTKGDTKVRDVIVPDLEDEEELP
jgi:hypothetical protein